jgi:hypothetical protein
MGKRLNQTIMDDSRKMRLAGHVAGNGEWRGVYWILAGRRDGRGPLGRPRRRRKDILKWILKKWDVEAWTGLIWLRRGTCSGRL